MRNVQGEQMQPRVDFEYVLALEEELALRGVSQKNADPDRYVLDLLGTLQALPSTTDGWRDKGIRVFRDEDAERLRRDCALRIFDHVANVKIDGVADGFVKVLEGSDEAADPNLAATILARTLNHSKATSRGTAAIVGWAQQKVGDQHEATLHGVTIEGLRRLTELDVLAGGQDCLVAAAQARLTAIGAAKVERAARLAQEQAEREAQWAQENAERGDREQAERVLFQAEDADSFWQGYTAYAERFTRVSRRGETAASRQADLFKRWRQDYLEHRRQVLALEILAAPGQTRDLLAVPEGCEILHAETEPAGFAVFSSLKELTTAMKAYLLPRDPSGVLMELHGNQTSQNSRVVSNLLRAIEDWDQAGPDRRANFVDPAASDRATRRDYHGTSLGRIEYTYIQKTPDGQYLLNQPEIGLYGGAALVFDSEARLEYYLAVPSDSSNDTQLKGYRETVWVRPVTTIPALAIARHIRDLINPTMSDAKLEKLGDSIVRPTGPYDYKVPSSKAEIDEVTVGFSSSFHNANRTGYVPLVDGKYETIQAILSERSGSTYNLPWIHVFFEGLSPKQAATVWAVAQFSKNL